MTAEEVANAISRYVNGMGNDVHDVVAVLARDHRTLQQGVTRFCVAWLEECARKHEAGEFDLRNQASCELGKAFVERIPPEQRAMPFV